MADEIKKEPGAKIVSDVKKVVEGFLGELQGGRRGNWASYAQVTFRDGKLTPALPLFAAFTVDKVSKPSDEELAGYRKHPMFDVEGLEDCIRVVDVAFELKKGGAPQVVKGRLIVMREAAAYKPSPSGEWGVCPTSWRPA